MAKIIAPNKQYMGVSAGVAFSNGIGYSENEFLLGWFEKKGYTVERPEPEQPAKTEEEKQPPEETAKEEQPTEENPEQEPKGNPPEKEKPSRKK